MTITITTEGHVAHQEEFRFTSEKSIKRGQIVEIKASKPVHEKPYGKAEVLSIEGAGVRPNHVIFKARRVS